MTIRAFTPPQIMQALEEFLARHFEVYEIRRMIEYNVPGGWSIVESLPGGNVSSAEFMFATVRALVRHHKIDTHLWEVLRTLRPALSQEIDRISVSQAPDSAAPVQLVLTRVGDDHQPPSIEFVLQNRGSAPCLIDHLILRAESPRMDDTVRLDLFGYPDEEEACYTIGIVNRGWTNVQVALAIHFLGADDTILGSDDVAVGVPFGERVEFVHYRHADVARIAGDRLGRVTKIRASGTGRGSGDHTRELELTRAVPEWLLAPRPGRPRYPDCGVSACLAEPDTTYVCLFANFEGSTAQIKRYPILRQVPPNHIDVFSCTIGAPRSCWFDLSVEIGIVGGETLKAHHRGLRVVRPSTESAWQDLVDGRVFVRTETGQWTLADDSPFSSWRRRLSGDGDVRR